MLPTSVDHEHLDETPERAIINSRTDPDLPNDEARERVQHHAASYAAVAGLNTELRNVLTALGFEPHY